MRDFSCDDVPTKNGARRRLIFVILQAVASLSLLGYSGYILMYAPRDNLD